MALPFFGTGMKTDLFQSHVAFSTNAGILNSVYMTFYTAKILKFCFLKVLSIVFYWICLNKGNVSFLKV